jgi:hypothetical protein
MLRFFAEQLIQLETGRSELVAGRGGGGAQIQRIGLNDARLQTRRGTGGITL